MAGWITHILCRKKFGRSGILKPLGRMVKKAAVVVLIVYIPLALLAFTSNRLKPTKQYAAILLSAHAFSDYDHWAPPLAFLGSYPSWTLYFNSKGLKTKYFFSATSQDFIDILQNDHFQSIVLVGHGSFNTWRATDQEISNYTIKRLQGKFKPKSGEWFQLSCGSRDFSEVQLGEMVMAHGQSYAYEDEVGAIHFVIDALSPFWIIKSDTEKRYNRPAMLQACNSSVQCRQGLPKLADVNLPRR